MGDWAMIPPYNGPAISAPVNIEIGNAAAYQLYDLSNDIGQQKNLATENPKKLEEMMTYFETVRGKVSADVGALELK